MSIQIKGGRVPDEALPTGDSFSLCLECKESFARLRFDEHAEPQQQLLGRVVTLFWPDEHAFRICREGCLLLVKALLEARVHLWEEGEIPDGLRPIWEDARSQFPGWPGFCRLLFDASIERMLADARQADAQLHEAMFKAADEATVDFDEEGGWSFSYEFKVDKASDQDEESRS
jgi:hypothetical protein